MKTALLLIDIQKGFETTEYWGGGRNNLNAEWKAADLLELFRSEDWPRFIIQHDSVLPESPLYPSKKGHALHPLIAPINEEVVIHKNTNSAFVNTNLEEQLQSLGLKELIIVGLTTEHCISTTCRHASDLGFNPIVVSDATANFAKVDHQGEAISAEMVHRVELASLNGEFARIMDAESVRQYLIANAGV